MEELEFMPYPNTLKMVSLDEVCEWLKDNLPNWVDSYKEDIIIDKLRKAMVG